MKRYVLMRQWMARLVLGLSLLLAIGGLQAQPLAGVPALSGRVVDLTGTFTAAQKSELAGAARGAGASERQPVGGLDGADNPA